jgi:drug/metabolite transporter (DMT)-like permease
MAVGMGLCLRGSPAATGLATDPYLGNTLATAAGISWAFTLLGLRASALRDEPLTVVVLGNLLAASVAAAWAFPLPHGGLKDWLGILYLGTVQIALAYAFLTRGVRDVPALESSLLLLLEPVLNPVWAWLIHGEDPGRWSLAGGAVIVAAVAANMLLSKDCSIKEVAVPGEP